MELLTLKVIVKHFSVRHAPRSFRNYSNT